MKAASAGRWVWVECTVLVGFSRIYLGDHYPGDILSGALSGMALAESVQRVQQVVMRAAGSDVDSIDWKKL